MSTELLRIVFDVPAVARACEDMAWRQTKFDPATVRAKVELSGQGGGMQVIFTKKRVRKAKGATP